MPSSLRRTVTRTEAEHAVETVFNAMKDSLGRGQRIELRRFGVFNVKPRKTGIGRNPRTGEEVNIPPGKAVASNRARNCNPSDQRLGAQFAAFSRLKSLRKKSHRLGLARASFILMTGMNGENGQDNLPVDLFRVELVPPPYPPAWAQPPIESRSWRSLVLAVALFAATAITTLAAGVQFAAAYAAGRGPALDEFYTGYFRPFSEPRLFLAGIPFAVHAARHSAGARTRPLLCLPPLSHSRDVSVLCARADADRHPGRIHSHPLAHYQSPSSV